MNPSKVVLIQLLHKPFSTGMSEGTKVAIIINSVLIVFVVAVGVAVLLYRKGYCPDWYRNFIKWL